MTPLDVIKQRLQLGYHKNIFDCGRSIIQLEGIQALYRSFPTTLFMNIPYGCLLVAANESLRRVLNPGGKYSLQTSMIAGSISGAIASIATTPLDVVKTRLQTQDLVPFHSSVAAPSKSFGGSASGLGLYPRFLVTQSESVASKTCEMISPTPVADGKILKYSTFVQTVKRIYSEEGLRAFWRGAFPRTMVQAPSAAISWTAYEFAKSCLVDVKE
jgi:solute carrier family 25 (mitochondrial iron transporter), member 28/37